MLNSDNITMVDLVELMSRGLYTAMPGVVDSFDSTVQTIKVQPCIKLPDANGEVSELPVLDDVPVQFFGTGDFVITAAPKKGDYVLLIWQQASIDRWISYGGIQDPQDLRHHDLSDCVAILGLFPNKSTISSFNTSDLEIRKRDGSAFIQLKANGEVNINDNLTVKV